MYKALKTAQSEIQETLLKFADNLEVLGKKTSDDTSLVAMAAPVAAPAVLQHRHRNRDPQAPALEFRHDTGALRLPGATGAPPARPAHERTVALPHGDRRQRDRPHDHDEIK